MLVFVIKEDSVEMTNDELLFDNFDATKLSDTTLLWPQRLDVIVELGLIFAKDATEKASISAADILKRHFRANMVAIFYKKGQQAFRFCLAGSSFPISLQANRWDDFVKPLDNSRQITRLKSFTIPGFERRLTYGIAFRLIVSNIDIGGVFLGRNTKDWTLEEEVVLSKIAELLSPIIDIRREREREEAERKAAENALARSEKHLRQFFEESLDMIYSADSKDTIIDINSAGLKLLGYNTKAPVLGKPMLELVNDPSSRKTFFEKIRKNGSVEDYEIVLRKRDGSLAYCVESAHATLDKNSNVSSINGIIKDLTDRITNERELWAANVELIELNEKLKKTQSLMVQQEKLASIGQLAAGIAHEINNPIGFLKSNHASIFKYLDIFHSIWKDALASGDHRLAVINQKNDLDILFSDLEAIKSESDEGFLRIIKIVADLMNFSRVDSSDSYGLYDVNAGIRSTLTVAKNIVKYVADVQLDLSEVPQILARGGEINQVILNIIVNAAQAIEAQKRADKGEIRIKTDASEDWLRLMICDDGPGIPDGIKEKIFDPFFTTKAPGNGTGLGLSVSYDIIVRRHNGKISCESTPENGTIFTIELPILPIK